MARPNTYITDWGALALTDEDYKAEEDALKRQRALWRKHRDDTIGVPEVEVWNDLIHKQLTDKAFRLFGKDGLSFRFQRNP